MCSWVNKKDGQPSISFVDFTPKKKSKGIVFYDERMEELKESPHLARGAVLLTAVKIESEVIAKEEAVILTAKKRRGRQKITLSADSMVTVNESLVTPAPELNMKTPTASRKRVKIESEVKALDFSSPVPTEKKKRKPRKLKSLVLDSTEPLVMQSLNGDTDGVADGAANGAAPAEDCPAGKQDDEIAGSSTGQGLGSIDVSNKQDGNSKVRTRSSRKRTVGQVDSALPV